MNQRPFDHKSDAELLHHQHNQNKDHSVAEGRNQTTIKAWTKSELNWWFWTICHLCLPFIQPSDVA